MSRTPNIERYKVLIDLKDKQEKSLREIAKIFNVSHMAIKYSYESAKRWQANQMKQSKRGVKVIHS